MMENFSAENFETQSHSEELDFIYGQDINDIESKIFDNRDLLYDLKMYFRLFRKKYFSKMHEKKQKNFTNIVYLTLDCPPFTPNSSRVDSPLEYINKMRSQYPHNDIRVVIPIFNVGEEFECSKKEIVEINNKFIPLEKTSVSFDFFLQNHYQKAILYKFPKNDSNIQVYGLYCTTFSRVKSVSEFSKLQILAPFVKSARLAIKKLYKESFMPDIVHCENIPFFLGGEFKTKLPYHIKIIQGVRDFTLLDVVTTETFWAAINLVDNKAMKKICADEVIKKYVAKLFNLHNTKRFYQVSECLKFIYKNYYKFRKYVDKGEDIEENIIFNRLNSRINQLFPQIAQKDKLYFNPMLYSIKRADYWITTSESYYNDVFENPKLAGSLYEQIEKTKGKSDYVSYGINPSDFPTENTRLIYHNFNKDNFREERRKNKDTLLKEFSFDRIKTNFVDPTLFRGEGVKIIGNLDSFNEAPLLFANPSNEIFAQGIDVLFNTVLKLFELHKNIQVIIAVNEGLKNSYISNWVEFLAQNKYLNGKWVFIDGQINVNKFYAGSDMVLLPRRANTISSEHYVAMHYGCVPIASRCGILNDTIADIFDDISCGCGFKTKSPLIAEQDNNEVFMTPVLKALNLFQNNPSSWNLLIKNCMNYDSSWGFEILEKYDKIYKELI